jgi:hypothetical protein
MNDLFDEDFLGKMKEELVRMVVAQENPTLERLNQAFREEFGAFPGKEHLELFGQEIKARKSETERLGSAMGKNKLDLAREVASQDNPTVETLNKAHRERFNEDAAAELIEFFKMELQKKGVAQSGIAAVDGKAKVALLKSVVAEDNPTVARLQEVFRVKLGTPVPAQLLALFKIEVQKKEATKEGISYTEFLLREVQKKK